MPESQNIENPFKRRIKQIKNALLNVVSRNTTKESESDQMELLETTPSVQDQIPVEETTAVQESANTTQTDEEIPEYLKKYIEEQRRRESVNNPPLREYIDSDGNNFSSTLSQEACEIVIEQLKDNNEFNRWGGKFVTTSTTTAHGWDTFHDDIAKKYGIQSAEVVEAGKFTLNQNGALVLESGSGAFEKNLEDSIEITLNRLKCILPEEQFRVLQIK